MLNPIEALILLDRSPRGFYFLIVISDKGKRQTPPANRSQEKRGSRLFVVRPEPDDLYCFFFFEDLVDQTVLNIDPS